MVGYGFLAIWTEIDREDFVNYRHWLTREHIGQRIFAPGFLGARVHAAPDNELAHFILYATERRGVLQSEAYLRVLNNPSPWTQEMMPRLKGFDRAAGEQLAKVGDGTGAWLVVSRIAAMPRERALSVLSEVLSRALEIEGVVTARLFGVDQESTSINSAEKQMRLGAEGAFQSLLVIEACTRSSADVAKASMGNVVTSLLGRATPHDVTQYQFVYALHPFEASTRELEIDV